MSCIKNKSILSNYDLSISIPNLFHSLLLQNIPFFQKYSSQTFFSFLLRSQLFDFILIVFHFSFFCFHFLFTEHQMLQDVIKLTSKIKREKVRRNKDQLFVNGYRFVIASQSDTTIYLKCANFRNKCTARASRRKDTNETFISKSQHAPNCMYHAEIESNLVAVDEKYNSETIPTSESVYFEEKSILP